MAASVHFIIHHVKGLSTCDEKWGAPSDIVAHFSSENWEPWIFIADIWVTSYWRFLDVIMEINQILFCSALDTNNDIFLPQFCTWHDSFAVVPCAKLWISWIMILQGRIERNFVKKKIALSAHNPLVKQFHDDMEVIQRMLGYLGSNLCPWNT